MLSCICVCMCGRNPRNDYCKNSLMRRVPFFKRADAEFIPKLEPMHMQSIFENLSSR